MIASVQWLDENCGVVRIGPDHYLGGDFIAVATIYKSEPNCVKIFGFLPKHESKPTATMIKALFDCLIRENITSIEFERRNNGKVRFKKYLIPRYPV